MKIEFKEHKENLFKILLGVDPKGDFLKLIDHLYINGNTKKEIYELFLDFHLEIQKDSKTKDSESVYDVLSDFMDGFTPWGKSFKILPNEPDL